MRKQILCFAFAIAFITLGLSIVSHGDESDKDGLTKPTELQALTRPLDEKAGAFGVDTSEIPDMWRNLFEKKEEQQPDAAQLSRLLKMLDKDEISKQQLREAVASLIKEMLSLQNRVAELEQNARARVMFP